MKELAFILNLLGLAATLAASLIKGEKMKKVLVLVLIGNALVAIGYLCSGTGINGAASGLLACVQTLINFIFDAKNKPIPKWLIGIYIASFIAVNILVGGLTVATLLASLACIAFIVSILQKSGKNFRICAIVNTVIWISYDIFTGSYSALITHGTILAVNVVGFLIHDLNKKKRVASK